MYRELCAIVENKCIAPNHYVLKLKSKRIAPQAKPGQFVQVVCSNSFDPLLPRPFSFLTTGKNELSLLYQVVGKGTQILSKTEKGSSLWLHGPLGNGFTLPVKEKESPQYLLVGGGVGIPPLYHFAETVLKQNKKADIRVFLGGRHKSLLLCEDKFKKLKTPLQLSTNDGSKGIRGFVTDALKSFLAQGDSRPKVIYTCGPTPMLKAVSNLAREWNIPCEVSVEVPMACGFGVCLGCAIKVCKDQTPEEHRFAIACTEGPVFMGEKILWE